MELWTVTTLPLHTLSHITVGCCGYNTWAVAVVLLWLQYMECCDYTHIWVATVVTGHGLLPCLCTLCCGLLWLPRRQLWLPMTRCCDVCCYGYNTLMWLPVCTSHCWLLWLPHMLLWTKLPLQTVLVHNEKFTVEVCTREMHVVS